MRTILLFIDGLGLGDNDVKINPCAYHEIIHLSCFKNGEYRKTKPFGYLVPTETTLSIDGLPQSATGQSTLFTGENCSKLVGRHLPGFPNETLRKVLKEKSILKIIKEMGHSPVFINAYRPLFFQLDDKIKWRLSTTTIATLAADIPFRTVDDILINRAIYHDFTNISLVKRGFSVPILEAKEAGQRLAQISKEYDFVLYEYFLTDRAGHSQKMEYAIQEIQKLDHFLTGLLGTLNLQQTLVILTSDHGNIEDLTIKTHTTNPAMTRLWGKGAANIASRIKSITDIAPAVYWMFQNDA